MTTPTNKDSLREVVVLAITKRNHANKDLTTMFSDITDDLIEALTSHIEEADRKTLETLAAILNGDERQVEIAKTYILNKLKAKEPKDQLNSKKGKPEQNILTRKEQER